MATMRTSRDDHEGTVLGHRGGHFSDTVTSRGAPHTRTAASSQRARAPSVALPGTRTGQTAVRQAGLSLIARAAPHRPVRLYRASQTRLAPTHHADAIARQRRVRDR